MALVAAKLKVKNETEISVGSQVREDDLLVKRTFGFLLSRWERKKKCHKTGKTRWFINIVAIGSAYHDARRHGCIDCQTCSISEVKWACVQCIHFVLVKNQQEPPLFWLPFGQVVGSVWRYGAVWDVENASMELLGHFCWVIPLEFGKLHFLFFWRCFFFGQAN